MAVLWGIILIVVGSFAWLGQSAVALATGQATRLGLIEREEDCDPGYYADARGEAIWDAFVLWSLPLAGVLLVFEHPWWRAFGLMGGASYFYFAGRGIAQRLAMRRRGIRAGKPPAVRLAILVLGLWGLVAIVTLVVAMRSLHSTGELS